MKLTTTLDFGADYLHPPSDVIVEVNVKIKLSDMWKLPNIREVIADAVLPRFREYKMSERSLGQWKERILYSGDLIQEVDYPYHYDAKRHRIVDERYGFDYAKKEWKVSYPVKDYLEGSLPESGCLKRDPDDSSSEHKEQ